MSDDYMAVATEFSKLISNEVKAMKLTDHTGMAELYKTKMEEKFAAIGRLDFLRQVTAVSENAAEAVRRHGEEERQRFLDFLKGGLSPL